METIFTYQDETDHVKYEAVRTDNPGKRKQIRYRRPDGNREGAYAWNLEGVEPIPYNLPKVVEAVASGSLVCIVEGEKNADDLNRIGYVATTNCKGAGKWTDSHSAYLKDAHVVIFQDFDEPGRKHAEKVAESVCKVAKSVRTTVFHGDKGFDVSDWLSAGGTREELDEKLASLPLLKGKKDPRKATSMTLSELMQLEFEDSKWVVEGVIGEGCTILGGKAKVGKTFLAFEIALAISGNRKAFKSIHVDTGRVLYLAIEGTWKNFQKRFKEMLDGDLPNPNLDIYKEWPQGEEAVSKMREYMEEHPDTVLIVVDTFKGIRKSESSRKNAYDVDYESLKPISDFCEEYGVNVLCLHHTNKATWDDPFDLISGSMGSRAAADNEAVVIDEGSGYIVLHAKGRDQEYSESLFQFEGETLRYEYKGDSTAVQDNQQRQLIFDVLKEALPEKLKPVDLFPLLVKEGYERTESAMRKMLRTMIRDSSTGVIGNGTDGYTIDPKTLPLTPSQPSHASHDRAPIAGRASSL